MTHLVSLTSRARSPASLTATWRLRVLSTPMARSVAPCSVSGAPAHVTNRMVQRNRRRLAAPSNDVPSFGWWQRQLFPHRCVPQSSELFQEKSARVPPIRVPRAPFYGNPSAAPLSSDLVARSPCPITSNRARANKLLRSHADLSAPIREPAEPPYVLFGCNRATP